MGKSCGMRKTKFVCKECKDNQIFVTAGNRAFCRNCWEYKKREEVNGEEYSWWMDEAIFESN